ncbi:hypothetical protein Pcac1_g28806 [Phytophthora cactorum]|nr:hypothetical protein Pcac1_g28806 [Phytophthora cactorum]
MSSTQTDVSEHPMRATIEYDNGKTLMAQGPQALHDHVASRMEKALGRTLPQMEVRFKDVSISADIVVKDETDIKVELPTLANELMKSVRGMGAKKHTVKKQILKNVSGVFKPGTITLVLGQPGSGILAHEAAKWQISQTRRTSQLRARSRTTAHRPTSCSDVCHSSSRTSLSETSTTLR